MTHLLKPDETYIIDDNKVAMEILTEHRLLSLLVPKDGYNSAHVVFRSKNHWCMAVLHTGHPIETENGYNVVAIPQTKQTREQVTAFFAELIAGTTGGKLFFAEMQPVEPINN